MNKKAQAEFLRFIAVGFVLVVIFALVAIPVSKVFSDVVDELVKPVNFGSDNRTVAALEQVDSLVTPAFDQLIFVMLIAAIIGMIVIAIFSDFHPVLLIIMILTLIIFVILGGLLANVYDEVRTDPEFSEKADEYTLTNAVLGSQFPIIILVGGAIAIIILFAKRGRLTAPI